MAHGFPQAQESVSYGGTRTEETSMRGSRWRVVSFVQLTRGLARCMNSQVRAFAVAPPLFHYESRAARSGGAAYSA